MTQTIFLLATLSSFVGGYRGELRMMRVTAYCPCNICCKGSADNITANGHRIKPGEKFCAADRRYAFGTMFRIPGYGTVPCWDRGGKIKGNCIDVFFDDKDGKSGHQRAIEWGVKNLVVTVER